MIYLTFLVGSVRRTFFFDKVFSYMFIYLIITMKLVFVIKVYRLFMVYDIVYVMLLSFINEKFNFCINNVVGKHIINKIF